MDIEEQIRRIVVASGRRVDIPIYVKPEASETRLSLEEGELVFYTEEPPVKGRANASLIGYLSRTLRIPSSRIQVVRGARSRSKVVRLLDVDPDMVAERLARLLGGEDV